MLFSRLINPVLLAVAVMLAQWVGMVHRIEHHQLLDQAVHQSNAPKSAASILHDCLLFDAVSTAHAPTCSTHALCPTPRLSVIGGSCTTESTLPAHDPHNRVRVRDPPFHA